MKTGLESLDTGAPDITYSGNEGPKSPQEDQQKMAEFQMQEYMEEFERVFPEMKDQRGTPDYMKELQDYFEGLASKQSEGVGSMMAGGENDRVRELLLKEETKGLSEDEKEELRQLIKTISAGMEGGIGDMAMKSGLIDEYRNYKMGQEDAGKPFMSPRDYYRSLEQDRMGAAGGGIMGSKKIKGQDHMLAYITPGEANTLEDLGGQKTMTPEGIPAYPPPGEKGGPGSGSEGRSPGEGRGGGGGQITAPKVTYTSPPPINTTRNPFEETGQTPQEQAALTKAINLSQRSGSYVDTLGMSKPQNLLEKYVSGHPILGPLSSKRRPLIAKRKKLLSPYDLSNPNEMNSLTEDEEDELMRINKAIRLDEANMLSQSEFERIMGYQKPEQGGEGNPYILPQYATMGGGAGMGSVDAVDPTTIENEFVANFLQPNKNLSDIDLARVNRIGAVRAADGGRIGYAGGGITDLRQGYFLGKLVKKAARGIKKLVKSPVGKAALLYAGGTYLGGMKGFTGLNKGLGFKNFGSRLMNPFSSGQGIGNLMNIFQSGKGNPSPFKFPGFGKVKEIPTVVSESDELTNAYNAAMKAKNYKEAATIKSLMKAPKASITDALFRSKADKYASLDPFKIGILGASALTGLYAAKDQDDEPSLDEYLGSASRGPSIDTQGIRQYIAANKGRVDPSQYAFLQPSYYAADGGRIGLKEGLTPRQAALSAIYGEDKDEDNMYKFAYGGSAGLPPVTIAPEGFNSQSFPDDETTGIAQATPQNPMPMAPQMDPRMMQMAQQGNRRMAAMGGRMGFADGGAGYSFGYKPGKEFQLNVGSMGKGTIKEIINSGELNSEDLKAAMDALRNRKAEGGMMDMGGMEKDYRNEGGFVPIGGQERADDVPARLSKNEFVFTADAVRNAGGGDIDKGAEVMENLMNNLEQGGQVSQGSQGLEGAREMFATQQRLGEVL